MAVSDSIIVSKSLTTISLERLRTGDAVEGKKLLSACQSQGFFYLDLSSDLELCAQWEGMLGRMKDYFDQPLDVKLQDVRNSHNYGYIPVGTEEGFKPEIKDGYETIKLSRREYLKGSADLTSPSRLQPDYFFAYIKRAHAITRLILERLSSELNLTDEARFETNHEDSKPSLCTLILLHYPKNNDTTAPTNVGHLKHTDIGSITLVLSQQWGLQFLSPTTKQWEFLEPRPKHAIVNVGDFLRFLSGGKLASIVHRVVPLAGRQTEDRYSIAYFLRMHDDAQFTDFDGKTWTAKEWHDTKYDVFKSPSTLDVKGQFLTAKIEEGQKVAV
ncbi:related to gibberellin 20-oxidase [Ramularia collo-cygni]|uniref:Related to gibberellin 20-oxidase n=1 Tax=Ramularia collo-cygni TaxID=112498 RepID=A0A2D3USN6_9PEZI|nr:related to gibberellin 20-oxidase [Ramularia collo-cygni]CZT14697.1 related to gibberellin 20-oxidase [Ramularia collo-cygni]